MNYPNYSNRDQQSVVIFTRCKSGDIEKEIKGAQSRLNGLKSLAKLFKFRCL